MGFFGFGFMEMMFPIFFTFVFVIVFVMFGISFVQMAKQHHHNQNSPELTVSAGLVSKREHTVHHHDSISHTYYYLTFEVESGDRIELQVEGETYGLLVEGDVGRLTFKGTEFIDFVRK